MVTRETRYPVFIAELLIENFKCQVVELVQRPTTMLEDTLFQWELLIFSKFTGDKVSLWPRSKTFLFIGRRGIIWYQGSNFSKLIHRGRYRGISQGHLDRVCKILLHSKMVHLLFIYFVNIAFTRRGANSAYPDKHMAKKAVFQGLVLVLSLELGSTLIYDYQSWCRLVNNKCLKFSVS